MKVVILCGGMGTRLREETEYRPKPMVEIGGMPILWHIMKMYAHHGFNEFVLCLGYKGNMIKEYFLNYEAMNNDFTINLGRKDYDITFHSKHSEQNYKVTLADTGINAMTGSRVKQIKPYIDDDVFMVTYGDGLSNINLRALVNFHKAHGRLATVTSVQLLSRYGILELTDNNVVSRFVEKPKLNDWVNAGFFVFNRQVFDYIEDDPSTGLEEQPIGPLIRDSQLVAYRHDGFFLGMDTYKEQYYLNTLWEQGNPPWKVWED